MELREKTFKSKVLRARKAKRERRQNEENEKRIFLFSVFGYEPELISFIQGETRFLSPEELTSNFKGNPDLKSFYKKAFQEPSFFASLSGLDRFFFNGKLSVCNCLTD